MTIGRILGKFVLSLVLLGVGTYFLIGSDTTTSAQTAAPDYKVDWTATKFLVMDWEELFYPDGGKGSFSLDPADNGAKQRLAIGVHEWKVIYSVKKDGCNQNVPSCYETKYEETWQTGADPSIPGHEKFAAARNDSPDNCYKVPANCKPGGIYAGEWNWSFGSEFTEQPNIQIGNKTFRDVTEVGIANVSDRNLYVNNSQIYLSLFNTTNGTGCENFGQDVSCWQGPRGFGPGFLEVYQCSNPNSFPTCKTTYGFGAQNQYNSTYFHTSGPYAWQHTFQRGFNSSSEVNGSDTSGTLSPTKWFVKGTLYD